MTVCSRLSVTEMELVFHNHVRPQSKAHDDLTLVENRKLAGHFWLLIGLRHYTDLQSWRLAGVVTFATESFVNKESSFL